MLVVFCSSASASVVSLFTRSSAQLFSFLGTHSLQGQEAEVDATRTENGKRFFMAILDLGKMRDFLLEQLAGEWTAVDPDGGSEGAVHFRDYGGYVLENDPAAN